MNLDMIMLILFGDNGWGCSKDMMDIGVILMIKAFLK